MRQSAFFIIAYLTAVLRYGIINDLNFQQGLNMRSNKGNAIVIGASTGIGHALVRLLCAQGYTVGMAARRVNLLEQLQKEINVQTYIKQINVADTTQSVRLIKELITEMNGVDIIIINAGVRIDNRDFILENDLDTIDVNVYGFVAMAHTALNHFLHKGHGCLIGVSSIASLRGSGYSPAYNASKAFVSNYMSGLRQKCALYPNINIIDIRPGFVDTPMVADITTKFWVATPEQAAIDIMKAAEKKKKVAYITPRWTLIAILTRMLPESVYNFISKKVRARM